MVDTEGSEVHTNELEQPIKAEARSYSDLVACQPTARTVADCSDVPPILLPSSMLFGCAGGIRVHVHSQGPVDCEGHRVRGQL